MVLLRWIIIRQVVRLHRLILLLLKLLERRLVIFLQIKMVLHMHGNLFSFLLSRVLQPFNRVRLIRLILPLNGLSILPSVVLVISDQSLGQPSHPLSQSLRLGVWSMHEIVKPDISWRLSESVLGPYISAYIQNLRRISWSSYSHNSVKSPNELGNIFFYTISIASYPPISELILWMSWARNNYVVSHKRYASSFNLNPNGVPVKEPKQVSKTAHVS